MRPKLENRKKHSLPHPSNEHPSTLEMKKVFRVLIGSFSFLPAPLISFSYSCPLFSLLISSFFSLTDHVCPSSPRLFVYFSLHLSNRRPKHYRLVIILLQQIKLIIQYSIVYNMICDGSFQGENCYGFSLVRESTAWFY